MLNIFLAVILLLGQSAAWSAADGNTSLPLLAEMFQDHAVLQRDSPIPIWGDAQPGETVHVSLDGHTVTAGTEPSGHWRATLPSMPAGGPYSLTVATGAGSSRTFSDVLVGDVYLCSGQSNMELPVSSSLNATREIEASAVESIHVMTVRHASSPVALSRFQTPVTWQPAGPDSIRDFSAACFYFARDLHKTAQVPLGLIHASWGGSRIEPWMSDAGLRTVGGFEQDLALLRTYADDAALGNRRFGAQWESWWHSHAAPDSSPWKPDAGSNWRPVPMPLRDWKTWGVAELLTHDGMVWFRHSFNLSAQQSKSTARLSIGAIDEVDETWVNGHPIANSFGYGTERTYSVPAGLLRAGANSLVINVLSTWDAGGMYGPPEHMQLQFSDGSTIPLGDHWVYDAVPERVGYPPRAPWTSVSGDTTIYNAMIAPLGPYGLRGVLWYQGESNTDDAAHYQALLAALMRDWRRQFARPLPFLVVQLPNFGAPAVAPADSSWASLREAQRRAVAADGNAALAVTIDLGVARELHPPDKQMVGARLARAARHLIYRDTMSASGAAPGRAWRESDQVIVELEASADTLVTYSSGRPIGFELCGAGQTSCRFADARLEGKRVMLNSTDTTATRVRFCWGGAPLCNLYDSAGLPVGPFEIDIQ